MTIRMLALIYLSGCGGKSANEPCMDGFVRGESGQCEAVSGGPDDTEDASTTDGTSGEVTDTGEAPDGGTGTGDEGGDSGGTLDGLGTDGDSTTPGVSLETGDVVVCETPSARESAPFVEVS